MIGDRARQEIILNTIEKPLLAHMRVNISGYGVPEDQYFEDREHGIYETAGSYFLGLRPSIKTNQKKAGDYIVFCDMYKSKSRRFVGWEDFVAQGERDNITKFLLQYTQISDKLFEVAAKNKTILIPFSLDTIKYSEHLKEMTVGASELLGAALEIEAAAAGRIEYKRTIEDKKIVANKLRRAAAREKNK